MPYYAEPTMLGASLEEQIALEEAVVALPGQTREGGMITGYPEDITEQMTTIAERGRDYRRDEPSLEDMELKQAGVPPLLLGGGGALIPAAAKAASVAIPAAGAGLARVLGLAGLGVGAGLGLDSLFGETSSRMENGFELGGPALKEPSKDVLIKEWHVSYPSTRLQYYLVQKPGSKRRYIMMYNTAKKTWKTWAWRKPHLAVIGKNMPSHKMLTRLRRNLKRHQDDAKTLLRLVSPASLKTSRTSGWGGRHRHTRRK